MRWLGILEIAISIAVGSCIIWHGMTIKVGDIFSYELYPLSRLFK